MKSRAGASVTRLGTTNYGSNDPRQAKNSKNDSNGC